MIRSIPQLEALRDEWEALAASRRSPLLELDWFLSCAEAFHREGHLCVVTSREAGCLVGVAPLVQEASRGRRLALLGASQLYEPCDWLHVTPAAASDLADRVLALGEPVVLQRLPAGGATVEALRKRPVLKVVRDTAPSLAVPTTGQWSHYQATLSGQTTTNLRRVRRKAEAVLGPMTISREHPVPGDVDTLLESFIDIEGSGWKGRRGSSLASRADLREFFRRYAHRLAARGQLQVARLKFGSRVAAAELSVIAHARAWQLKIGYHEALKAYYPGLHLTAASIEAAFAQGLESYEFLGSAAPWEERWRPETRSYQTMLAYPASVAGLTGLGRDLASQFTRHLRRVAATS